MNEALSLDYEVCGEDFTRAGEASSDLKTKLKQIGVSPDIVRKVAIAMYEGEINMFIHASGGNINVKISPEQINITLKDNGPGIESVEKAMQEGFSTADERVRQLGFGAGMGLPNMKKYSDDMKIDTVLGVGTTINMKINL